MQASGVEQLVFIAVVAVISLVNWLMQKSAEQRERRKQDRRVASPFDAPRPVAQRPFQGPSDAEESMRKLMEALGLPTEAAPPKPPRERARPVPEQPPPLPTHAEEPKAHADAPEWRPPPVAPQIEPGGMPQIRQEPRPVPPPLPVRRAPVRKPHRQHPEPRHHRGPHAVVEETPALHPQTRLRELLASREGLQSAVLLRELLGKPKGLVQPER